MRSVSGGCVLKKLNNICPAGIPKRYVAPELRARRAIHLAAPPPPVTNFPSGFKRHYVLETITRSSTLATLSELANFAFLFRRI